ncbi:MAG: acyl-[acyl-carrier-protein] thioesterase [Brevinematales bacterium]
MTPRYENRFDVRFTEKSPIGTITLATLCRYLLEVADDHAYQLGVDFETMFSQGLTWALLRVCMEIKGNITSLSDIVVATWPTAREGLYVYRDYAVFSSGGESVAQATSQWVILDRLTRKPVRPPDFLTDLYSRLYGDAPPPRLPVVFTRWNQLDRSLYPVCYKRDILIRRSDTDINGHTNTAAYIEFMEEAIPLEWYRKKRVCYFELHCLIESFDGEELLSCAEVSSDEREMIHTLIYKRDNVVVARGKSLWE